MLRREFFAKLGLGVLAMAATPLVVLGARPVRAVVSNDPGIDFETMDSRHVFRQVAPGLANSGDVCWRCGYTRLQALDFDILACSGKPSVAFIMNFGDSA